MVLMVANGSLVGSQVLAFFQAWLIGQRWTPTERIVRLLWLYPAVVMAGGSASSGASLVRLLVRLLVQGQRVWHKAVPGRGGQRRRCSDGLLHRLGDDSGWSIATARQLCRGSLQMKKVLKASSQVSLGDAKVKVLSFPS
jgi:hypothetical protein